MALGASYFHDTYTQKPQAVIPDTAGCLPSATKATKTTDLFQYTFKCACQTPDCNRCCQPSVLHCALPHQVLHVMVMMSNQRSMAIRCIHADTAC